VSSCTQRQATGHKELSFDVNNNTTGKNSRIEEVKKKNKIKGDISF
jgi:hypothetical protein